MTKLRFSFFHFAAAGFAIVAVAAPAQEKRPMTIVELIDVPSVGSPRLSPDGSELLYTRSDTDWEKNGRTTHIHRIAADGSGDVRLTNGENGESSPRWSPDGAWVAFLARRGESPVQQIHRMPNRGGEASPLTQHESSVQSFAFSPDGAHIYFLAPDPKTAEEKRKDDLRDDFFAFDEDYKQRHLFRVATAGDGPRDAERITRGDFSILEFRLSHDGTRIAHSRAPTPLLDNRDEGEVWLMDADGGNSIQLTDNTVIESGAQLSPDGSQVLFVSASSADLETYFNRNVFLVPAAGGPHRVLYEDWPYEANGAVWAPDGSIYFIGNTGVRSQIFHAGVGDAEPTPLTAGDHSIVGWNFAAAGQHVFGISNRENNGDIHLLPAGGGEPVKVTSVFDYLDETFELPVQEAVRWNGEDGVEVEGLLFYPLDYQEGQRYPLVVQTHGGPRSSDKFRFGRWSSYVEILTARGYAVFKPNYRGSTGYGDEFLRDMVGHYFNQAHLDVMAGVDYLIERGIVDGDRMAKMGWSAGGHMTNKIITHTGRFKAASSGAGAVNWISMYGQSDVRHPRTPWFGGTPWQEDAPIDVYWGNSPLKDIYRVTTPTLVIVGENDVRVPAPQSVELYRALRTNGVDTHLYIAPREPHGLRELRHQLFKVNVELEWFERHVRGIDYEWEPAPGEKGAEKHTTTDNHNP
ncbi:MAG: S9 family peptidase [Acidobacteria bacterium]|nr:S9 family peptidase [Acidobacteriota bacterium]MYA45472.1 S9 family peptidase [Acidobacteriota bacterium]MYI39120.1 S9 family peptidase [Acidobacteriota bacterium]